MLNPSAHHMTEIRDIKIAEAFQRNEAYHHGTKLQDCLKRLIAWKHDHIRCNITNNKRDCQSYSRTKYSEKHIAEK